MYPTLSPRNRRTCKKICQNQFFENYKQWRMWVQVPITPDMIINLRRNQVKLEMLTTWKGFHGARHRKGWRGWRSCLVTGEPVRRCVCGNRWPVRSETDRCKWMRPVLATGPPLPAIHRKSSVAAIGCSILSEPDYEMSVPVCDERKTLNGLLLGNIRRPI